MRLAVFPHNTCWPSTQSPSGYATHGGIVLQTEALSELFDGTRVITLRSRSGSQRGEMPIKGKHLSVVPLHPLPRSPFWRRLLLPIWLLRNGARVVTEMTTADAVCAVIPGEIGTVVLVLALILRKPLLVRYIIAWSKPRTLVDRLERRLLERFAGDKNVVLATGEGDEPPSVRNPNVRWIFSTTLSEAELANAAPRVLPSSQKIRLIIVARQEVSKGTDLLLQALSLIRGELPDISLDVVGEGSAMPQFRRLAEELGLKDCVRFHGQVDHAKVLDLLEAAHLYCLPTAGESFGKGALEALACGLPVVTTPVSIFPRLVGTRCGVVLRERTTEELAAAVRYCLGDPARYKRMSTEAIAAARSYSLERWCSMIRRMLEEAWGPLDARTTGSGASRDPGR